MIRDRAQDYTRRGATEARLQLLVVNVCSVRACLCACLRKSERRKQWIRTWSVLSPPARRKKRPKGNRKELTVTVAAWHGGEFHLATIGGDEEVRWQPYIYIIITRSRSIGVAKQKNTYRNTVTRSTNIGEERITRIFTAIRYASLLVSLPQC